MADPGVVVFDEPLKITAPLPAEVVAENKKNVLIISAVTLAALVLFGMVLKGRS